MSNDVFIFCVGLVTGYIFKAGVNYFQLNTKYRAGQKYGYEIGLWHAKEASYALKFRGENENNQYVAMIMDIKDSE